MCGLAGYASEKYQPVLRDVGLILALYNENRGHDSWGMTDGKEIVKDAGPISRALYKIPFDRPVVALHTRAKTHGTVNKENAHPFKFGKIIGMHNGIIHNHDQLNTKFERKFEVDSMHIFANINEKKGFNSLRGYGAIVYFDHEGSLRLGKFNGGSLSIAEIKDFKAIIWSSQRDHLITALDATNLDYTTYQVQGEELYVYRGGELYRTNEKVKLDTKNFERDRKS